MNGTAAVHLFLALLWGQLALALAPSWQDGTYYSYGWVVLGACVVFYLARRRDFRFPARSRTRAAVVAMAAVLLAVLAGIAALRLFQGANPFWRLPLWAHAALTVGASGALLAFREGLRAARRYLPPLLLILAAVPLPSALETGLVQHLTRSVMLVSSDLARASGIPLEVAETAFLIRGQPLDVNDRCSGIRSFQSSLAVALVAGEMLRLAAHARLLLLVAGAIASFVGNTFRVLALVRAFFAGGFEALDARHDAAGTISVTLTYAVILGAGFLLERATGRSAPLKSGPATVAGPAAGWMGGFSRFVLPLLCLAIGAIELGRSWWLHPGNQPWQHVPVPVADLAAMQTEAGLTSLPLAGNVDTGPLRFDGGAYLKGRHEHGQPMAVIFFSYRPGNRNLWTDLFTHPPEVCMRSSGCAFEAALPARSLELGGHTIPVRMLKYRDPSNGTSLFILKAVWLPPGSPIQPGDRVADLRALWVSMALNRIPHPPGAVLLTGIWGVEQEDTAWEIFERRVARHFRPSGPPG